MNKLIAPVFVKLESLTIYAFFVEYPISILVLMICERE